MQSANAPITRQEYVSKYTLLDPANVKALEVEKDQLNDRIRLFAKSRSLTKEQYKEYVDKLVEYHRLSRRLYRHTIADKERLLHISQESFEGVRSTLEAQYKETKEKLDASLQKVDQLTKRVLRLETDRRDLEKTRSDLESAQAQLARRGDALQSNERRLQRDLERIRHERDRLQRDCEHLSYELDLIRNRHDTVNSQFRAQKESFEKEKETYIRHIDNLEREITDLRISMKNDAILSQTEIEYQKEQVAATKAASAAAEQKHQEEKAALAKELSESRAAQASLQSEVEKLRSEQLERYQLDQGTGPKKRIAMDATIRVQSQRIEDLEQQHNALAQEHEAALAELTKLRAEKAAGNTQVQPNSRKRKAAKK